MSLSLKWFVGDSKEALKLMVERNCAFLVYIGKGDDDIIEVFNDSNIIQLLDSELILCYKMDPASPSFKNFKDIFNNVVVPSIYLLEKNNIQQYVITKPDLNEFNKMQLDLKHQLLKAIHSVIKAISDTINADEDKKKYVQYLAVVTKTLQNFDNTFIKSEIPKVEEDKKSIGSAKIKIKVPCKEVTLVQEFQTTSSLNDVKTFVLNNVNLPRGTVKFIAHRQFIDEDFCQSLEALKLCPSSTIYVHVVPLHLWMQSKYNLPPWLLSIYYYGITTPYNYLWYFVTSFFGLNTDKAIQTKKKPTNKPASNIHQLRNNKPDDDDNNTYNGNSTQQL